jgi:hypothetical protein
MAGSHGTGRRPEGSRLPESGDDEGPAAATGPMSGRRSGRERHPAAPHLDRRQSDAETALTCPQGERGTVTVGQLSHHADPVSQAVLTRTTVGTMGGLGAHVVLPPFDLRDGQLARRDAAPGKPFGETSAQRHRRGAVRGRIAPATRGSPAKTSRTGRFRVRNPYVAPDAEVLPSVRRQRRSRGARQRCFPGKTPDVGRFFAWAETRNAEDPGTDPFRLRRG